MTYLGVILLKPRISRDREIKAQSREKIPLHENRLRQQCDTSPPTHTCNGDPGAGGNFEGSSCAVLRLKTR